MRNRKLIRLAGFNYSASRNYFFTICVKDHLHSFGRIENKSMILSYEGNIALEQLKWLTDQYPYIELITFIIMPDHVHGIIYIDSDFYNNSIGGMDQHLMNAVNNNAGNVGNNNVVGNGRDRSLQSKPKIKPLPELIGAYKTTVSKRIHLAGDIMFKWQKSYHEHIIRNNRSLNRIKHYIITNPENWM